MLLCVVIKLKRSKLWFISAYYIPVPLRIWRRVAIGVLAFLSIAATGVAGRRWWWSSGFGTTAFLRAGLSWPPRRWSVCRYHSCWNCYSGILVIFICRHDNTVATWRPPVTAWWSSWRRLWVDIMSWSALVNLGRDRSHPGRCWVITACC